VYINSYSGFKKLFFVVIIVLKNEYYFFKMYNLTFLCEQMKIKDGQTSDNLANIDGNVADMGASSM
jgi:hypothetical protein